jgi:hypothetical protein
LTEKKMQQETELMIRLATELDKETDRTLVILAASYLEYLLRRLVVRALKLEAIPTPAMSFLFEGPNAGLASFFSRIEMAKRLSLVSEDESRDLNLIRKIRNDFAHNFIGVSFATAGVANRCQELAAAKAGGTPLTARECFKKASVRLMVDIVSRIPSVGGQGPSMEEQEEDDV